MVLVSVGRMVPILRCDQASNMSPTLCPGDFRPVMRMYEPDASALDESCVLPAITGPLSSAWLTATA
jgi:hypothetical protein